MIDFRNNCLLSVCRFYVLVQQKDKWDEQEGCIRKEKEELTQQIQKNRLLQQENLQLKTEVDRYTVCKLQLQQPKHIPHLQYAALSSSRNDIIAKLILYSTTYLFQQETTN